MSSNRRRYPRKATHAPAIVHVDEDTVETTMVDYSAGGAALEFDFSRLVSPVRFEIDTPVTLEFGRSAERAGRVVRWHEGGLAMAFETPDEE